MKAPLKYFVALSATRSGLCRACFGRRDSETFLCIFPVAISDLFLLLFFLFLRFQKMIYASDEVQGRSGNLSVEQHPENDQRQAMQEEDEIQEFSQSRSGSQQQHQGEQQQLPVATNAFFNPQQRKRQFVPVHNPARGFNPAQFNGEQQGTVPVPAPITNGFANNNANGNFKFGKPLPFGAGAPGIGNPPFAAAAANVFSKPGPGKQSKMQLFGASSGAGGGQGRLQGDVRLIDRLRVS